MGVGEDSLANIKTHLKYKKETICNIPVNLHNL